MYILLIFISVSLNRESKHNQWLGVTVKSQGIGGKVVVRDKHQLMKAPGQQTTEIQAQPLNDVLLYPTRPARTSTSSGSV